MFDLFFSFLIGYFAGSIFLSYFLGIYIGHDLTKEGTGQLGASNAGRLLGFPFMVLTGIFDIVKATISLVFIWLIFGNIQDTNYFTLIAISCSCGLLIGHAKSIWIWAHKREWHGGKGAAPLAGIILFLSWISFIILYMVIMVVLQVTKKVFFKDIRFYENFYTNLIVAICAPIIIFIFTKSLLIVAYILFLEGIIMYFEKEKIRNILSVIKEEI